MRPEIRTGHIQRNHHEDRARRVNSVDREFAEGG